MNSLTGVAVADGVDAENIASSHDEASCASPHGRSGTRLTALPDLAEAVPCKHVAATASRTAGVHNGKARGWMYGSTRYSTLSEPPPRPLSCKRCNRETPSGRQKERT